MNPTWVYFNFFSYGKGANEAEVPMAPESPGSTSYKFCLGKSLHLLYTHFFIYKQE